MPKISRPRYVFAVQDLQASVSEYTEKMGFRILFQIPGWAYLGRDNCILMLGECPDEPPASELGDHSYVGYLEVEGIDALYEEYREAGVKIRKRLRVEPWGMKEFSLETIDGHRFMLGEEISDAHLT